MSEPIQQFLEYLQSVRHLSAYTAHCYGVDIQQFCKKLSKSILDTAPADVQDYIQLMQGSYSEATVARKVAAIRSFFKFCSSRSLIASNPTLDIHPPRQPKRIPKVITEDEVAKLLQTPKDTSVLGARDKAMLECLYSTGMRVSEVVNLNVEDIGDNTLRVHRGFKECVTPINQNANIALKNYILMRNSKGAVSGAIFVNRYGHRINTRSVRRKLDKYLLKANLDPTITPHTLRHSCAAHMLKRGVGIRSVQELLGHRSRSTTKIYTQI